MPSAANHEGNVSEFHIVRRVVTLHDILKTNEVILMPVGTSCPGASSEVRSSSSMSYKDEGRFGRLAESSHHSRSPLIV